MGININRAAWAAAYQGWRPWKGREQHQGTSLEGETLTMERRMLGERATKAAVLVQVVRVLLLHGRQAAAH